MSGFALFLLAVAALPAAGEPIYKFCDTLSGNYTANSTYSANLDAAALSVTLNAPRAGFATAAAGAVYALGLCRGDINSADCESCVSGGFSDGRNLCPLNKGATLYYDPCYVKYSGQNFLSNFTNGDRISYTNDDNVDPATATAPEFEKMVAVLLNLTADMASRNKTRFAVTEIQNLFKPNSSIYSLVQCTPDMPESACRSCLAGEIGSLLNSNYSAGGPLGYHVLGARCNLRYEMYPFFYDKPIVLLQSPAPVGTAGPRRGDDTGTIIAIVIPIAGALVITAIIILWVRRASRYRKMSQLQDGSNEEGFGGALMESQFLVDLSTIKAATNNFADANILGRGGFGSVYKGIFKDGQEVAVKRLSQSSSQGIKELKNEMILVAKLQHRNLVRLLGICIEEHERLIIYEYMSNKSLDNILFDPDHDQHRHLDWRKRYQIICGVAGGLQYLHEESELRIVHRDLKASNVLLDANMVPKISDFGLARLFNDRSALATSHIAGTLGYMSPEYAMRGLYSIKSDVYSFGVLVIEIVTGRKNTSTFQSHELANDLVSLVWRHWSSATLMEIVDPMLRDNSFSNELTRCTHIGLLCIQDNPMARPTMSTVVTMLRSDTTALPVPTQPAFCLNQGNSTVVATSEQPSINDVSITDVEPR